MCQRTQLLYSSLHSGSQFPTRRGRASENRSRRPEWTKLNALSWTEGNISKETKDRDNMLAKAQTLFLDALAPLLNLLESANSGNLTPEASANAVKTALALLGNALSKERRKLVVKDLNKDASSLAEDDDLFKEAAPMLFGEGFEQKLKNHVEAVRCLRKSSTNSGGSSQYFRGGRSHGNYQRGGGPNRRFQSSRGGRKFQPYQKENRFRNSQLPKTPS